MVVIASLHNLVRRLGLDTLDGVRKFQGQLVKNQRGRRDILRIDAPDDAGQNVTLFLKRILRPYRKDGLASLLRRGRVWSLSRQEWENMAALNRSGIPTAELVAFGEDCGLLWERFSFILTRAAPARQTVADIAVSCKDHALREKVSRALASHIRRMHDAGLATPDLFLRHFFVDSRPDRPEFWVIDMARLDQVRTIPRRLRARDLAAAHVGLPLRHASPRQRLRFLRTYCGGRIDRALLRLIQQRSTRLLRRAKFRDFAS